MDVVYRLGEATARRIESELPDSLANATVRTLLRILEQKGHLRHREEGRTFVYYPSQSKARVAQSALKQLLGVFYNGSVQEAVSGLLQMEDTRLTPEQYDELVRLIESAREREGPV